MKLDTVAFIPSPVARMCEIVPEEVLHEFALVMDDPDRVGEALLDRFGGMATRAGSQTSCMFGGRVVGS